MGEQQVGAEQDGAHLRTFMKHLLNDLRALEQMLDEGMFETQVRRIGAEQEMILVDRKYQPAGVAMQVLERLHDEHFTTELATYNIECNLDALVFGGDCLRRMERQLVELVGKARQAARAFDADILLTGIAPTLHRSHATLEYMTPRPRYRSLNDALLRLRGGEYDFRLSGTDEITIRHDSVMLEACNTSFQVHFQVGPDEFARRYNIAQAVCAPVLAVAANSPLLFGKRLWRETRIGLFQQAVDTRSATPQADERKGRVSFGQKWVDDSVLEILREDVSRFRVLLGADLEEDPFDALAEGRIPALAALRLHNSTVYRWNRPCYGINDGKPHLRIENRILPAGPTPVDAVANAAFWFGLMSGVADRYGDVAEIMDFDDARSNFLAAARHGLRAQFTWFGSEKAVPAQALIREELLPLAREGLAHSGIDAADADRYLGIIEGRVETGRTGAQWLLQSFAGMKGEKSKGASAKGASSEHLTSLAGAALHHQWTGKPVHTWPLAELDEADKVKRSYQRVEQYMTTDLFTVNEDDAIDLVANMMVWEGLRHVPVEDSHHRLVGLVSYRQLLRVMGNEPLAAQRQPAAVSTIMHTAPVTVAPETPTREAIRVMRADKVSCLPVVKDGLLVGIVTDQDFLAIAAEMIERELAD